MKHKAYPSTWEVTHLSDVVYFQEGPGLRKFQYREEGIPFLNIQTLENERVNKEKCKFLDPEEVETKYQHFLLETNDIVCSSSGTIGKTAVIQEEDKPLMLNTSVIRFRPWNSSLFLREYLHVFLKSQDFVSQALSASTGSAQVNFGPTHLKSFHIPVPPLNEQKRIVAKIETLFSKLDNGIAALKVAREQLKVYRQAVLKHAFEGKLTAKWREENADKLETPEQLLTRIQQERNARYQQQLQEWKAAVKEWEAKGKEGEKPSKPKPLKAFGSLPSNVMDDLPGLPNNWYWGKLCNLTTGVEYGTSAKSSETGLVPVIRMGNLQNGKIDWSDLVYSDNEEEIHKYSLTPGDVLFNRTNSPELVGKTAKYRGEQSAIFAGYLIRINQIDTIAISDYLNYFLNSHIAKQYGNTVKTDGVNQSNINGEKLQNYPFPFCSIVEQAKIVEILEEKLSLTESSIQDINFQLTRAETLRQSILKKAFSGRLVPQDPNDEPASKLLERIKKEKATQVVGKAVKKKLAKAGR